jgi:hypothetical protein
LLKLGQFMAEMNVIVSAIYLAIPTWTACCIEPFRSCVNLMSPDQIRELGESVAVCGLTPDGRTNCADAQLWPSGEGVYKLGEWHVRECSGKHVTEDSLAAQFFRGYAAKIGRGPARNNAPRPGGGRHAPTLKMPKGRPHCPPSA